MKQVVDYVTGVHGYSQRRACRLTQQHRSTQRKVLRLDPRTALRQRMHEIVLTRLRFGYRRIHILLKREGWQVGKDVVFGCIAKKGCVYGPKVTVAARWQCIGRHAISQPDPTKHGVWSMEYGFCP
ncbi:hypothetical protein IPV26_22455 [Brucella pituitosa]|uniref:Transposase n=1 Tax=Brucella pituitosa TaxID=571256 RepID=A0ABS3K676_9HYPH|nr:hypothetical protein [Brucella pituitosa]